MKFNFAALLTWFSTLTTPDPARDWFIASVLGVVVSLAGVSLAAYLFWGTQTGSIVAASQDVPRAPIPVTRDAMKFVIESYQERAANYVARNFTAVNLSDPRPAVKKK